MHTQERETKEKEEDEEVNITKLPLCIYSQIKILYMGRSKINLTIEFEIYLSPY
jgi:hypothetical protein